MLSYLQLFNENNIHLVEDITSDAKDIKLGTSHEITKTPDATFYTHHVGDHTIMTHFYKRFTKDGGNHYDVHFTRHKTDGKGKASYGAFSRNGSKTMAPADRVKSIRSVTAAVRHFVTSEKPASLTSMGNTEKKNEWAHSMLSHVAKKHGGDVVKTGKESIWHLKGAPKGGEQ